VRTTQPVVTQGDRLPGAPWTFFTSAEYDFAALDYRKPYLRVDYQLTTAQTALQPIQDPNNGVSDPTYTGLPQTRTCPCGAACAGAASICRCLRRI
jgi:hypothetical protein